MSDYVWTCCTPTAHYFIRGSRRGEMVDALLGDDFAGILVSDFSAGYAHYPGVKQKCWAHLLRDVRVAQPDDVTVAARAAGVQATYERAVRWKAAHAEAGPAERQAMAQRCADALMAVAAPYCGVATAAQRALGERTAKHLHELFAVVIKPPVPPDNNEAERSLRGRPLGRV